MKHLLKYLTPFAPDQSGSVAALFEFGGVIVICDAGGCTGNICGFDEPRWFHSRSAVFSAGLRDMDAILGRDDKLIAKLADAVRGAEANFIALVGTPVPAVIGTDFRALKRMAERATGLPVLALPVTGVRHYDDGASEAMLALFREFAREAVPVEPGTLGVLGATPLDFSSLAAGAMLTRAMRTASVREVCCYGMGGGLDEVRRAGRMEKNLVVAPSGLATAEYLHRTFGTPFETACPFLPEMIPGGIPDVRGKRVLAVHQQFAADALREHLLALGADSVAVASWFRMEPGKMRDGDFRLTGEDEFIDAVRDGNYDLIFADRLLKRALREFAGTPVDFPHFAVSGRLLEG